MSLELDHVFICLEETPVAERALADFGLQFGLRAIHGGQGTATDRRGCGRARSRAMVTGRSRRAESSTRRTSSSSSGPAAMTRVAWRCAVERCTRCGWPPSPVRS